MLTYQLKFKDLKDVGPFAHVILDCPEIFGLLPTTTTFNTLQLLLFRFDNWLSLIGTLCSRSVVACRLLVIGTINMQMISLATFCNPICVKCHLRQKYTCLFVTNSMNYSTMFSPVTTDEPTGIEERRN